MRLLYKKQIPQNNRVSLGNPGKLHGVGYRGDIGMLEGLGTRCLGFVLRPLEPRDVEGPRDVQGPRARLLAKI
jgi:hypothetical protein